VAASLSTCERLTKISAREKEAVTGRVVEDAMADRGIRNVNIKTRGEREYTMDMACELCGEDDPCTERSRDMCSRIRWLCEVCLDEQRDLSRRWWARP
jgi:hypothetical protein